MKITLTSGFTGPGFNVQPIKNGKLTILNNNKRVLVEGVDYHVEEIEDTENISIHIPWLNNTEILTTKK